ERPASNRQSLEIRPTDKRLDLTVRKQELYLVIREHRERQGGGDQEYPGERERTKKRFRCERNHCRGCEHHEIPMHCTRRPEKAFKIDPEKIKKGDAGK